MKYYIKYSCDINNKNQNTFDFAKWISWKFNISYSLYEARYILKQYTKDKNKSNWHKAKIIAEIED